MDHLTGFDDLRRFTIGEDDVMPCMRCPPPSRRSAHVFLRFQAAKRWRGYLNGGGEAHRWPLSPGGMESPPPCEAWKRGTTASFSNEDGRKLCGYFSDMKEAPPGPLSSCEGWTR